MRGDAHDGDEFDATNPIDREINSHSIRLSSYVHVARDITVIELPMKEIS